MCYNIGGIFFFFLIEKNRTRSPAALVLVGMSNLLAWCVHICIPHKVAIAVRLPKEPTPEGGLVGRGTWVLSPHSYPTPSVVLGAAYVLDGIHNLVGYPVPPRGGVVCGTNSTGHEVLPPSFYG
jgi:hypothetical protein